MNTGSRIYVAGHRGLVGSAICRSLCRQGYRNLLTRTHAELDLTERDAVAGFFRDERPELVFLAAARVGGIRANDTCPADFLRDNLLIQTHVLDAAFRSGVRRLLFLGSSCIYPRQCPQPIREDSLLAGPLEPTNDAYAIAKIAGIKACESYNRQHGTDFAAVMPTNLYGPNDNFDLETSHVLPALIRKFHEAKAGGKEEVVVWGTGTPRRELLHADDMAEACVFVMGLDGMTDLLNIGTGRDVTIRELAGMVRDAVGFDGRIVFDPTRPDGTPCKRLDVSRLERLGWKATTSLRSGIASTYAWYRDHLAAGARVA